MVEFTRLSSKGQVIIPREVRESMRLEKGAIFAVIQSEDNLCLRRVEKPETSWNEIAKPFREAAKKSQFTQKDLFKILSETRKKR